MMKARLMIVLAMIGACSLNVTAMPKSGDTIRTESQISPLEMLLPLEPSYLNGVLVDNPWNANWFVGVNGAATAFLGNPLGCEDLFGRIKPSLQVSIGKWFTPSVGGRIVYQGFKFKDCNSVTQKYQYMHADFMWDVLGRTTNWIDGEWVQTRWGVIPFAGVGLLHNKTNANKSFALAYGVIGQYRVTPRFAVNVELSNATTFQSFDGNGSEDKFGDHLLSLSAGVSVTLGKVGWNRAVDAKPYMRQNEWLTDYSNELLEANREFSERHQQDLQIIEELKKILEIEGLLDLYRDKAARAAAIRSAQSSGYPRNNYSGLNSLRARMRAKADTLGGDWHNGMLDNAARHNARAGANDGVNDAIEQNEEYLMAMLEGKECIGAPIFFFFIKGTTNLTDRSQLVNIDEIVKIANKYGLAVEVTGAADSATGSESINTPLSEKRASYIAEELAKRGVPEYRISQTGRGGIAEYSTKEANRHTKVALYFPQSRRVERPERPAPPMQEVAPTGQALEGGEPGVEL